jgi:uncharacterized protein YbjT (DUF2867 family)
MTALSGNLPRRALVFGASGHIGGPLARWVARLSPATAVRLATSSPDKTTALERLIPDAEVCVASYLDPDALRAAFADVSVVFVITPDFFDEVAGMACLTAAARAAGSVRHIVRLIADVPGVQRAALPREIVGTGCGPGIQHILAREILEASGIPVSFLNSAGYFMDDLLRHFAGPLKRSRRLVVPFDRHVCFTDTEDLAEVGARLLLATDPATMGRSYQFNSGEPALLLSDVAALMSRVLGVEIVYDGDPRAFRDEVGAALEQMTGRRQAAEELITYFALERDFQGAFYGSALGYQWLARAPRTLEAWLAAHKDALLA